MTKPNFPPDDDAGGFDSHAEEYRDHETILKKGEGSCVLAVVFGACAALFLCVALILVIIILHKHKIIRRLKTSLPETRHIDGHQKPNNSCPRTKTMLSVSSPTSEVWREEVKVFSLKQYVQFTVDGSLLNLLRFVLS